MRCTSAWIRRCKRERSRSSFSSSGGEHVSLRWGSLQHLPYFLSSRSPQCVGWAVGGGSNHNDWFQTFYLLVSAWKQEFSDSGFQMILLLMWTILKVFTELVAILLLFFVFCVFGHEACQILVTQPGMEPVLPALEGEVLPTGLPGRSSLRFPFSESENWW